MSIGQILSAHQAAPTAPPASPPSPEREVQKDINAVAKALNADDMPAAKNAASQLQEKLQNIGPPSNGGESGKTQISNAVKALNDTLKTGNVADAKKAFAVVQQAQQNKIDQKNNVSTRELASKPVLPPSDNSAVSSSIGRNIDTRA